ncbi:hypothetical protein [Occallatibacter riparius]|uniref:Uncharacterized protein n=1 Tax=Occallatibacter riparius TaxID=1002689 RepID=A0A9J7BGL8_9BACT|nr:hypothetical protein [Occallatibacter riparius]UWZ81673.1 hypothetical protein MOP44_13880 [Occallatibacter riparius]
MAGILVSAIDTRGFVYALLELAERVQYGDDPLKSLQLAAALQDQPANEVRGVSRYFCSELEDKPWYYDRSFWSGYLDRLVASRFNRFTMAFGLEYDFPRGVTDDYFHFVYPYLVDVPEYPQVRVIQVAAADGTRLATPTPLSADERAKNLDMLRFIAAETAARGLQFQLGIWTHAYQWTESPDAYHRIEGLTPENHAHYCRDALAMILRLCPEIQGLTLRVHGESGIPEGSYAFWQTVFEAIAGAGRTIEVDMHAKGVDEKIIDIAVATGMPVKLGAKYSAEHQSLGYQQADIRALEIPHGQLSKANEDLFRFSSGSRSFTRYGYADFLRQGTRYKLWFRLWPGTQRHLLSVDPEMAAAYGRTASFCGATGLDLMEPLTFKGREGSGQQGGRCAYVDPSLSPSQDWEKYDLYYRVWGRRLYNPDGAPETWRRAMRTEFGSGTEATESSLAHASRILPLLTSAHLPSASNHDLWYELPTNMPIVEGSEPSPYGDTPVPKIFGAVSPLDPQIFSSVAEYVQSLVQGAPSAKYSPIDVARWLEQCVSNATHWLNTATRTTTARGGSAFRRIEEDVLIQIGLGTFFAHKLRSAVLYDLFQRTEDTSAGNAAIKHYQQARDAWSSMAQRAKNVYRANVSYGSIPKRSGHWFDRLPEIDKDLAAMKATIQLNQAETSSRRGAAKEMNTLAGTRRPMICQHTPPQEFAPGEVLALRLSVPGQEGTHALRTVRLRYRHVNQAERWQVLDATSANGAYATAIPKEYTESGFSLEYYFELADGNGRSWMYPAFNESLSNQPYFAVCKRAGPSTL